MHRKQLVPLIGSLVCLLATESLAAGRVDLLAQADCGAIPDDGIDDTPAIQSCINQLQQMPTPPATTRGGVIFFEQGVYTISTLRIEGHNIVLEGLGAASVLSGTKEDPVIVIDGNSMASLPIAERNTIRLLHITNREGGLKSSVGILIRHAYWTVVESVLIDRVATGIVNGIAGGSSPVDDNFRTRISNCTLINPGGGMTKAGIHYFSSSDSILENTFVEPAKSGVGVQMSDQSNGLTVEHLLSLGGRYGVRMEGSGYARLVRNSIIEGASEAQVLIDSGVHDVSVVGSWLGNGGGDVNGTIMKGILIQPNTSLIKVVGNRIGDQSGQAIDSLGDNVTIEANQLVNNGYGANSGPHDSVLFQMGKNITFRGNTIVSGGDLCAIKVAGTTSRIIVKDNINELSGPTLCWAGSGPLRISGDNIP